MQQTLPTSPTARSGVLSYLSLFTSLSTLLCCALPSLLVLFGLGATVASFLSAVLWLVALSRHKHWVFIVSGMLIFSNILYVYALPPRLCNPRVARGSRFSSDFYANSGFRFLTD